MPDRTNVNDALFPDDNIFNDDYTREVNASIEDHRNAVLDYHDTAVIFTGLTIETGTGLDTVKVLAGRGADIDGYRIIVPLDVDNIATLDTAGNPNYIAIRHVWAYSGARLPAKAGAVTYSSVRSDDYEINVALAQQNEAAGWILLGYTFKSLGIWYFVTDIPTNRSRDARTDVWSETWGYPGPVPAPGTASMYHHGVQAARVHPETTILIQQIQASVIQSPVVATISFTLLLNGAGPPWPAPLGVTIPVGQNYASFDLGANAQEIDRTDYIGVQVTGNAGLTAGGNCFCRVSGTVRSGI